MMRRENKIRSAEDLLSELRITNIPVSVEDICAREGFNISVLDFSEVEKAHAGKKISGALILKNGEKDIIVNQEDNRLRQRFTIAHELGHYYLHHIEAVDSEEHAIISFRGDRNVVEFEADRFAAELLMPSKQIDRLYKELDLPYISVLANKFDVSRAAMRYRLDTLDRNYIDL